MNEYAQAKLQELERRQRDIADAIQQLREAEKEHEPEVGDVYVKDSTESKILLIGNNQCISLKNFYTQYRVAHDYPVRKGFDYMGKFDDVYITKKRVAEILTEVTDFDNDNIFSASGLSCASSPNLARAFAAEGITEIK